MTWRRDRGIFRAGRRRFLRGSAGVAVAATATAAGLLAPAAPAMAAISGRTARAADLPGVAGPRCVVVGGGVSGLTIARALKQANPAFDVVMVEPNATYMSCFFSNLWLADLVNLKALTHSYCDAARDGNYVWLQGKLIDLDREARRAYTSEGYVDYQYIVIAPGVDYNYASLGLDDPAMAVMCAQNYPAAFKPGSEHLSLKKKLKRFQGGIFLMTVPSGNYRCLPAPYERACMVAAYFKHHKIKGKVLLLDASEKPFAPLAPGFLAAFDQLYKAVLEYMPLTFIQKVDPVKKIVATEFDSFNFDDASIYPRIRAARLIEDLGLHDPHSPQIEAHIDVHTYSCKGDEACYVTGDARPMPFSKSANTAHTEAQFVARLIAAREAGRDIAWESPLTICYPMVDAQPEQAIMVQTRYAERDFSFTDVKIDNERSAANAKAGLDWGEGLYRQLI